MGKNPRHPSPLKASDENLHRIAISNLHDSERSLIRWWTKKYSTPAKPLFDHTFEELMIELLEDYYESHQTEAQRFLNPIDDDWDGTMSPEYEAQIKKRLGNRKVDLGQYKSDVVLTKDQEEALLANLGKNLPDKGGFEDVFGA